MIAIKLNAGNDRNGNPRRGWLIIDGEGNAVNFVDEGYRGNGALAVAGYLRKGAALAESARYGSEKIQASKIYVEGPTLQVPPGQYRDLKREFKA